MARKKDSEKAGKRKARKKTSKKKASRNILVSKVIAGKDLKRAVSRAVELIGGFLNFIGENETIVVKPNFNTNDEYPGSSDPEFVKAVIELLYQHGARKVIVAESSCFHENSRKMMAHFLPVAEKAKAEVVILDEKNNWKRVEVNGKKRKFFDVSETYLKARKTIWLPCMKTHKQAGFTLSLKLPMGMIKGANRMKMHIWGLQEKIADMNLAVPAPDLIIMDARKCFITGGPSNGEVREPDLIMAADDRIALDVEAVKVIQEFRGNKLGHKNPWDFKQVRTAVENRIDRARSEEDYKVLYADTLSKKREAF